MKTKEELNTLKNEVESLNEKLAELNEGELEEVIGGVDAEFIGQVSGLEPAIRTHPNASPIGFEIKPPVPSDVSDSDPAALERPVLGEGVCGQRGLSASKEKCSYSESFRALVKDGYGCDNCPLNK